MATWAVALAVVAVVATTAACGDDGGSAGTTAPATGATAPSTAPAASATETTTAPAADPVDAATRALQEDLIALGFFSGSPSGEYDGATRTAVIAFQRAADLEADGVAGPQTHAAIDLARGRASSGAVRLLQQAMTAICVYSGPIDGVYGTATEDAVRAFQQQQGISADGRIGPQTARALAAAYLDRPASCAGTGTTTGATTGSGSTPAPSGPTITVSGPSYTKTFHVTSCRSAGETDIALTATAGAYRLRLATAEGGRGAIAITGGDEQDGIDLAGAVTGLTVGDAGDVRASGRFAAGSVDGDRSFTVAGRCG